MFDSTSAIDIPASATMVAGYVDGLFAWDGPSWGRFGNATRVRIAVRADTDDGVVGDVETGDMLPWELPGWVQMRRAAGVDPTGYVNLSNWNPTRTEFQLRSIPEPHWWLADYDGLAVVPTGTVAKQYANAALSGGHYDLSAVADYWPGVDDVATIDDLLARLNSVYSSLDSATQNLANDIAGVRSDLATLQAKVDTLQPGGATKLNITLSGTAQP